MLVLCSVLALPHNHTYAQVEDDAIPDIDTLVSPPILEEVRDSIPINSSLFNQSDFSIDTDLTSAYDDDEYQYTEQKSSSNIFERLKNWLAEFIRDLFNIKNNDSAQRIVNFLEVAFYVVVIVLVAFFIIKAIRKRQFKAPIDATEEIIDDAAISIAQVMKEDNFALKIQQLESAEQYRYAIRYYFIWLLKSLKEKNIIQFSNEKTAEDYIPEIQDPIMKQSYKYASCLYNYIWFGKFDINESQYAQYAAVFQKLIDIEQAR